MSGNQGVYVHLPFCRKKCPYCHFFVLPDNETQKDDLLEGLILEWRSSQIDLPMTSIYFGGGTPTLFGAHRIEKLLQLFSPEGDVEITIEANPEDVTVELMRDLNAAGVNRVSIGIQSLDDTLLARLGRGHSAAKAKDAVTDTYTSGFENITIDLMYDIPGQTLAMFEETLKEIAALPITHLSLYNLVFEPGSLFFKQRKKHVPHLPPEEISLALLNLALSHLEKAGLKRYEISAFARPGFKARHNTGYWLGRPFIGLGPSAFSYIDGRRFRNVCNLKKYLQAVREGSSPLDFEEKLPYPQNIHELLAVNLRLVEGVDLKKWGPLPKETEETIARLIEEGYLEKKERLALTERGLLFYDTVASEII